MTGSWRALPVIVRDAALAATTALVTLGVPLLTSVLADSDSGFTPVWGLLVCAVCAPLAVRRRLPLTAALASGAVVLLAIMLGQPPVGAWVTVAAFGSAAYHRDRGRPMTAVTVTCWLVALDLMLDGTPPYLSRLAMSVSAGLAPVALGHALRLRHDRARHLALVERAEERARIARDVHDVVGHHLSAIRLQAVGARRGTAEDADRALETIAEISATALGETRRLLGLLRDEDGGTDLGALAARLSRQGLRVRLDGDLLLRGVSPQVRNGVYRIVQESLTNVMRHSGVSHATVRVGRSSGAVSVVVEDDGRALPADPDVAWGSGVRGMRERAVLLGGTLSAGPYDPHGWRVAASLPLDGTREAATVGRRDVEGARR
ncbi:sensor histidine kinase [Streptosporangium saharense]|uniref:histidine kinase n=1 Tax=Streptosporangium saharense TaxID=1706840 RepID=A0A7W7VM35_9ACTN|nr:sensor histidine kinase [Streptosporangium saharense]MBB4914835.1 signal transduction histidine kinase [Streptosporangium saharense]